jgi:hypothetical protein
MTASTAVAPKCSRSPACGSVVFRRKTQCPRRFAICRKVERPLHHEWIGSPFLSPLVAW